jgi:FkbM family methyltransferase
VRVGPGALTDRMHYALLQLEELGLEGAIHYKWERLKERLGGHREPYALTSKHADAPVWVRPDSSDLLVFNQIFVEREYRCLDGVKDATFVIDCGANVGYSAAYFLSRFPKAHLIAIEPDGGNFAMLRRNIQVYSERAQALQAGVWSRAAGLIVQRPDAPGGKEWAFRVREASPTETSEIDATDLTTVWRRAGSPEISVLKVDIEGSEDVVFSAREKPWLDSVRNLVIELHNEECAHAFFGAIDGMGFKISRSGELTVCMR